MLGSRTQLEGKSAKVLRGIKPRGFSTVTDLTVTSGLALQIVAWKRVGERERGGLSARPGMVSVWKVLGTA